ncbi:MULTISPECIES: DUF3263 domain-containing protein [Brevibacterium]|jgi:hypothetical protein|uniref:Uncharacterized protein n=6 Tax=Brevibacterium TaxID=1696 RepID=A0A0B9A2M2_BRELN|nr:MULTISPECIES: DUF3263 domain-containing protein [Brevibacterium]WGP05546.1 DUF3263 domain-containing protein [Bacillus subtilis]HJE76672.1 DUF3263 domain-containing protein [Brevibacterium epidermidis]AZU01750.1 DUF3263 domain-containing protein [Brevibacterium linens]KAB1945542.1 DUF3263 domain-containing protein [Brevibacterium linens ATCC 9172]KHS53030.1 Protein of unknown function DUF3263 [Brevibacterium linens]
MPPNDDTSELSELEVAVLEFERRWWKYGGAKDHAIRERFDMSATSYFQILNSLLDNPAALASDPMLVKRLRRIRSTRQSERAQARVSR